MVQLAARDDLTATVSPFPGASATPAAFGPEPTVVAAMRRAARDHQVCAPLPLERLAASRATEARPDVWARALIGVTARGADLVFHRSDQAAVSASECWLASLVAAVRARDVDSAAFLSRRFVAKNDRRLALCFAQRLASALERRDAA